MLGGYMGRLLWVDLTTGAMKEETPDESLLRDFVGGYGIGARLLYSRMRPGTDPLGPGNILGITTGPITGSPAPTATRWTVVGRSPLTGGWGDANGSGFFGQALKCAGYDAVFFTGISPQPVYLFLDDCMLSFALPITCGAAIAMRSRIGSRASWGKTSRPPASARPARSWR